MKIKKIPSSEITPEHIYHDRRNFIKNLGLILGSTTLSAFANKSFAALHTLPSFAQAKEREKEKLSSLRTSQAITIIMNLALQNLILMRMQKN